MSPFDFIKILTTEKVPWQSLSAPDKKSFNPYMVNRILSMNPEWIDLVNYIQIHPKIPAPQVFSIYSGLLPNRFYSGKYIKKIKKESNPDMLRFLAKHFSVSQREAEQYLRILSKETVGHLLAGYGYTDKEIKKFMK